MSKVIAITMGDPAGIGPEIIAQALQSPVVENVHSVVVGSADILKKQLQLGIISNVTINVIKQVKDAKFSHGIINVIDVPVENINTLIPGKVQKQAGDLAYRCVKKATELAMNHEVAAIATAPLNKEALHSAGHMYPGHTELLAELTNSKDYAMVLYTDKLKVIHVTTHVSLRKFLDNLNSQRIETVIGIANDFLKRVGYAHPRIAVAGVNPHAGENGLFGDEEIKFVTPAIEAMRAKGIDVTGPCPPDTVFLQTHEGKFDMVVAMYHDQGHIPLKLLGFYDGVNIAAGLPFIRTSADHGTAFDIAWKGIAKADSMIESIRLAAQLA
ncbi:4-hydroxythreonine-4-phosphate dehydrogenase PdxA [Zophobihabitans entericus]|uniref:4-hydroxythreonine-4-phosphate dehydrogenase PdxA n=1 Tax=Zophobihabitans entericus TaxID=1635327 RepID=A0A6G9IBG9_9GAMM|nr:4-hydroxythreonine-4-phosphate dehydrogenase PdxA [Zophobihabitans entericus]QIQ21177.1 4-hydroxythreonine-4-phosphate dehydrogenase PdxA [Zophobihabitans entericus]